MKRILVLLMANISAFMCFAAEISVNLLPSIRTPSQPGALTSMANLSSEEDVVREHRLGAGAANVQNLEVGDVLILALFEDREVSIELVSEERSLKGRAFLGRDRNGLGLVDCVVLETERGLVVDVTDSKNNRVWKVISDENGVQVKEVKPTQRIIRPSRPLYPPKPGTPIPVVDVTVKDGVATAVTNRLMQSFAVGGEESPQPDEAFLNPLGRDEDVASEDVAAGVALPTIDILVVYDTQAAAWARSNGGGIQSFAETSVQKMNTAIANTGLNSKFSFRLVGVYEVGGSAGGDLYEALYFATGTEQGTLNGVSWAGVQQKRNELYADIVCTLVDTGSAYGTTGLGWSLTTSSSDIAFCGGNVCSIRAVSQSHTMTHEVGHNMGAGHSDMQKSSPGPQYHSYSSGYYFTANGTKYYTIMAYNSDGYGNYYSPVPYFSSPDYTYNGVAVGNSTHNNSKTLSLTYPDVVKNRQPPYVSSEVGVGLDAESYEWTTDGTFPWARVTDRTDDGVDSASSCLTKWSEGTTSWTETKVVGPATLSFSYFIRSAGGEFRVTCDNSTLFTKGSSDINTYMYSWDTVSNLSIPSGTHTIRFAHINNSSSYYSPANAAWVDKVVFSGGSSPSQTYTIAFNANGGSPTPPSITRKAGETYDTLPTPTRTGYALAGWYTAASGGTKVSSTTKATASTTLYAHWTPNTYSISYELGSNGSHGSYHQASATYDVAFPVSAPTRAGYTFAGWTVASELDTSTAKWGTTSSPSTAISSTTTKCKNGQAGTVYFKNLTPKASGSVKLLANWDVATILLTTALDSTKLSFTTGGNATWFGQGETTHDGADAARSGKISDNGSSWMQTTVTGPGIISFWWYVSSEDVRYDYLEFLDGTSQLDKIGGTSASWTKRSFQIGAGSHTLKWNYKKDGSAYNGLDAGFVDQVEWTDNVVTEVEDQHIPFVSGGGIYSLTLKNGGEVAFLESWLTDAGISTSGGITASLLNAIGRNGLPRYQSLLFGLDPESSIPAEEQIKPTITFDANGMPHVSCTPRNDNTLITYTEMGKPSIDAPEWVEVTDGPDGNRAQMKFFKIKVELAK